MSQKLLTSVSVAALVILIGCQQEYTTVSVRFAMPPELPAPDDDIGGAGTQLAAHEPAAGFGEEGIEGASETLPSEALHVALWGGDFTGENVTHTDTSLKSGHYTFALLEQAPPISAQGWIHVDAEGKDFINILRQWKEGIPTQKLRLAYERDLEGKVQSDAAEFKTFTRQVRALERLERRIDEAIAHESRMQQEARRRQREFLNEAVVLVLPGNSGFLNPVTRSAFSEDELARVREGDVVTKMLLVADHRDIKWKQQLVTQLGRELRGCRASLREEVARLVRCRQLYSMTGQLYKHNRKLVHEHNRRFVENEMHIQATLGAIEQIDEQLADLRERRLVLAFAAELTAPEGTFRPLEEETRDLAQERIVLEADKHRLDLLFDQSAEDSTQRVALERRRQRQIRVIEDIDYQLSRLEEARTALVNLKDASEVIHRQGEFQLLAASFIGESAPTYLRNALEREAVITVRLQASDNLFVPSAAEVASAQTH